MGKEFQMNKIVNAVKDFSQATLDLKSLVANEISRPWYTSAEDFHTTASNSLREKYEEQEDRRTELMSIVSGSADILIALEREIGTGRVMRLASTHVIDPNVIVAMLNY